MQSVKNRITYAEIYELLELLGDEYKKKIPVSYYNYIIEQKPQQYDIEKIRENVANDELSEEALKIFTTINIEYFIEDELAKKAYKEIITAKNSNKKNVQVPKIDPNNIKMDIFEDRKIKKEQKEEIVENKEIIQYNKTNLFSRLLDRIKKWLKK